MYIHILYTYSMKRFTGDGDDWFFNGEFQSVYSRLTETLTHLQPVTQITHLAMAFETEHSFCLLPQLFRLFPSAQNLDFYDTPHTEEGAEGWSSACMYFGSDSVMDLLRAYLPACRATDSADAQRQLQINFYLHSLVEQVIVYTDTSNLLRRLPYADFDSLDGVQDNDVIKIVRDRPDEALVTFTDPTLLTGVVGTQLTSLLDQMVMSPSRLLIRYFAHRVLLPPPEPEYLEVHILSFIHSFPFRLGIASVKILVCKHKLYIIN